jgi:myosin heavy subunit
LQIFCLLSAILWLGNVRFAAAVGEGVSVVHDSALETAAHLLGIPKEILATALTTRNLTISKRLFLSVH